MPAWLAYAAVIALYAAALVAAFAGLGTDWNWRVIWDYRAAFVTGWLTTLLVSAAALAASTAVGLAAALALGSRAALLRAAARVYVEVVRGTPLLVQILVGWYVIAAALRMGNDWRYPVGIAVLSLFSGAYMAEIFRAGIDAIPRGQIDAARAIGLTPAQTTRLVVLPQAVRIVLPAMAGQLASLVKDSSLLYVIGIAEFTYVARNANVASLSTLECYLPLAVGYLLLTLPLSACSRWLERRFRYEAA